MGVGQADEVAKHGNGNRENRVMGELMETVCVKVYGKTEQVFLVEKTMPNMGDAIVALLENQGYARLLLVDGGSVLINFGECMAVSVNG